MNYADIKQHDVANGPGVRVSVFVSGCSHYCKGCFNQEAWDYTYGNLFTEDEIDKILEYLRPNYIYGLSLLGGEPLDQANQKGLLPLLRKVKSQYPNKDIWCYTGYDFEKDILDKMMNEWKETKELFSYIDVLVDGKYVLEEKSLKLRFKGSSNQRIIRIPESLDQNKLVLWDPETKYLC